MKGAAVIPYLDSAIVASDQSAVLGTQVHSSGKFPPLSSYGNTAGKNYSCPISVSRSPGPFQDFFLCTFRNIFQTFKRETIEGQK